jgi:hypothetical protein
MFKLYIFIKRIFKNALSNAINVNFLLWINNVYTYIWPCSLYENFENKKIQS